MKSAGWKLFYSTCGRTVCHRLYPSALYVHVCVCWLLSLFLFALWALIYVCMCMNVCHIYIHTHIYIYINARTLARAHTHTCTITTLSDLILHQLLVISPHSISTDETARGFGCMAFDRQRPCKAQSLDVGGKGSDHRRRGATRCANSFSHISPVLGPTPGTVWTFRSPTSLSLLHHVPPGSRFFPRDFTGRESKRQKGRLSKNHM